MAGARRRGDGLMSGATAAPDRAGVRSGDRAAARADRDSPGPGRAAEPEPAPGAAPRGGSRRGGLTGSGARRASRPPPAWRLAVEAGPGLAVAGGRWLDGSLVEADRWAVGDAGGWWPGGAAGAGSRAAERRGGGPRAVAGRAGSLMARCPARRPVPGLPAASNKRGSWQLSPPQTVSIRRSDDILNIQCFARDGRGQLSHSISSESETGKWALSFLFFDFGITDAVTDKHRRYAGQVVIPGCVRQACLVDLCATGPTARGGPVRPPPRRPPSRRCSARR